MIEPYIVTIYYAEKNKLWNPITKYQKVQGTKTKMVKSPYDQQTWFYNWLIGFFIVLHFCMLNANQGHVWCRDLCIGWSDHVKYCILNGFQHSECLFLLCMSLWYSCSILLPKCFFPYQKRMYFHFLFFWMSSDTFLMCRKHNACMVRNIYNYHLPD